MSVARILRVECDKCGAVYGHDATYVSSSDTSSQTPPSWTLIHIHRNTQYDHLSNQVPLTDTWNLCSKCFQLVENVRPEAALELEGPAPNRRKMALDKPYQ